jgi:hypothetical protein
MSGRVAADPRLIVAALLPLTLGVFLLAWTWSLVDGPRFDSVPTTRELFSYRTDTPVGEITSGVAIEQSFLATRDYLTQVDINMATYVRDNSPDLVFELVDENGVTVRRVEVRPETIIDNQFHAFRFEPIADSTGEQYIARLTSPDGQIGDAFTAWAGDCDCYPGGALFVNGVEQPDSELAMRASYTRPGVVVWRELLDRMSQYKPLIFKGAGLVLVAAIATAMSLAALGWVAGAAVRRSPPEVQPRILWLAASLIAVAIVLLITTPYSF